MAAIRDRVENSSVPRSLQTPERSARRLPPLLPLPRRAGCLLAGIALLALAGFGETRAIPIDAGIAAGEDSGVCILRVRVDGSSDLMVRSDTLTLRAVHGENPLDEGSVCSAVLPESPLGSFHMESVRGRGRALLVENPSGRNGFQAWIRVDDNATGADLYELRITWQLDEGPHEGPGSLSDELVLRPRGTPAVWATDSGAGGSTALPGSRLSSFDNDSLRYDSSRAGQLEFRGRIDNEVDLYVRGDQINSVVKSGQLVKVERFRFTQPLPAVALSSIGVAKKDGRGSVELLQRPDSTNDFTAIIRVTDPQSGSDRYHFVLSWAR